MTITALSREWHARTDHPRYIERLASVGPAQSVMSVASRMRTDTRCRRGETGEVEAKGTAVMLGYWNNPVADAETLKDGWLRTGDVGRLDEDGFLTLSDRSKDVIISAAPTSIRARSKSAADACERARGLGDRRSRPGLGRNRRRLRGAGRRRGRRRRRLRRALPCLDRALQAAEALCLSRRDAQEQLRQGAEDRVAGDDARVGRTHAGFSTCRPRESGDP